jgi:hypothetical protein
MRRYVQSDLETDRQVATALAELIIGGMLASVPMPAEEARMAAMTPPDQHPVYKSVYKVRQKRPPAVCRRPLTW